MFQDVGRIAKVRALLAARGDGQVTNKQIGRVLGISEAKVELYLFAGAQPKSLEDGVKASGMRADQEGDLVLADVLEDSQPTAEEKNSDSSETPSNGHHA